MSSPNVLELLDFWESFQDQYDDWYSTNYFMTADGPCLDDRIDRFCSLFYYNTPLLWNYFGEKDCETYCEMKHCSLYWTKQAKICCAKCNQTCPTMGDRVRGSCRAPMVVPIPTQSSTTKSSTKPTTKPTISSTTERTPVPISTTTKTSSLYTTISSISNSSMYTKQPFGKSPWVSIPIGIGILFIFMALYQWHRKRSRRSTENSYNDQNLPNEFDLRPCAPPPDNEGRISDVETNIISPEFDRNTTNYVASLENQPPNDPPPSYDDCVRIAPPSYNWQTGGGRNANT